MSEYGQVVGAGTQAAGGANGAGSSGVHMGDPFGTLNGLIHSATTAAAGLPPAVLAAGIVLVVIVFLVALRRAL